MDTKLFYTRLNEAMDTADISQADIADKLGVSRNTISNWKKGSGVPSAIELFTIASLCKRNINWFFTAEDEEKVFLESTKDIKERLLRTEEIIEKMTIDLNKRTEMLLEMNDRMFKLQQLLAEYQLKTKEKD